MAAPVISVLVPVYNAAQTLDFALRSVREQSFGAFECILVDDGSTDSSVELMRQFAESDARFVVHQLSHAGIVRALNYGIEQCRGRYVARFDADDWMVPHRLERQLECLEQDPGLSGVGCHVELFPRERLRDGRLAYETWLNSLGTEQDLYRDRFVECPLAHPTFCFKREVLTEYRYLEHPWAEDYDLLLRLFGDHHRIGTVDAKLVRWRDSDARLSRNDERYGATRFFDCKAHYLARDFLRDDEPYWLWGYGDTGRMLCRALSCLGRAPEYIVERHPRRIGQVIAGANVVSPEQMLALNGPRRRLIVSVSGAKPRADVRLLARQLGLIEGEDFCCAA